MRGLSLATLGAPFPGCRGGTLAGCPGTKNCTEHWLTQDIDHFDWSTPLSNKPTESTLPPIPLPTTFQQRYFVNDQWWDMENGGPVFFYFGNEDNVELYVNHTGLMWESAAESKALLVFAEHRYYGSSLLYEAGTNGCMSFLTTEQATASHCALHPSLSLLPGPLATHSPVLGHNYAKLCYVMLGNGRLCLPY